MACNSLRQIFILFRYYLDLVIDLVFAFIWHERKPIPDVKAEHKFLAESATTLARKIRNKELKSEDLVRACAERIKAAGNSSSRKESQKDVTSKFTLLPFIIGQGQVNPVLNAMTDERFSAAIKEAQEIDKMINEGLPAEYFVKKPLLGVPFTAKESHAVSGLLHTLGVSARRHQRAEADAECVRLVRLAGGVAMAVTNVPEINKWQETRNMVFGQTNNPYHTGRTVGGSSGGEAALMAALATPISICSDIGGSTRMPAFYCGLFGHNPTAGTTSLKGSTLRSGLDDTMASIGFISRHAEDLAPLTRIVAAERAGELKLDRTVDIKDVKFYYMETATDMRCSSISTDLRKAMNKVLKHLSQDVSSVSPYSHEGYSHMFALWKYHMSKETEDFAHLLTNRQGRACGVVELLKKLVGRSEFTLAAILKLLDEQVLPTPSAAWAEDLTKRMRDHLTEVLGDTGVLLFPSCCAPAPAHYSAFLRPFNFAYWGVFNALRVPATQVPLGLNSSGLPLGIQVVAAPYNDALCLSVAAHLAAQFGGYVPPCNVAA